MTKPAKVLIADDVEAICALIQNFLPTAAFETRVASDGSAALEICRQWRPEVILLDIMMPIMSGFEVLKAIRAEAEALAGEQAEEGGPVIIMPHQPQQQGRRPVLLPDRHRRLPGQTHQRQKPARRHHQGYGQARSRAGQDPCRAHGRGPGHGRGQPAPPALRC